MKILILSHGFNMDGRAASQTITDKIPYLLEYGYELFVVSAITGRLDRQFYHKQLLPWGPNGFRFDFRHWLRNKIGTGFLYKVIMLIVNIVLIPFIVIEKIIFGLQSQSSWAIPAYFFSKKIIRKNNIYLVYSTGGAYSAHLAGYWLKKKLNIKWIAEIHDPMINNCLSLKTRDQKFQAKLERLIITYADNIWWFTQGALASAKARYPNIGNKVFMVLPGANPPKIKSQYRKTNKLHFAHFGSLSNSRSLLQFIQGLDLWLKEKFSYRAKIAVDIYGSSIDLLAQEFISTNNYRDIVTGFGRLEYDKKTKLSGREQIIKKMYEADCLLLLHGQDSMCSEYIPSKVYEYFWSSRPILALTYKNPMLDDMIAERGGYIVDSTNIIGIKNQIDMIFSLWQNNQLGTTFNFQPLDVRQSVDYIIKNCNL